MTPVSPRSGGREKLVNDDVGVSWLLSFLRADQTKTCCLYEAPIAEVVREAARRAGLPADMVVEVSDLLPEDFLAGSAPTGRPPYGWNWR